MEHETLNCPFCGAPYREVIPSGTVQVKCKYCGGTVLVLAYFGGKVRRCPNHPDALAVGLCNDCGESFCDGCLHFYDVRDGTLHLCMNCLKERETNRATSFLIIGVLALFIGFFTVGIAPNLADAVLAGFLFFGVLAIPSITWGIYKRIHLPKGLTIKERTEAARAEIESRKAFGEQASAPELYNRMLSDALRDCGPQIGWQILERRIDSYVQAGMTRSEAVRKLAEEKGY